MQKHSEKLIKSVTAVKNTARCMITFDNEDKFECSLDLVMKYNLRKGFVLSPLLFEEIENEQKGFDIKKAALNFASYKPRTVRQVIEKLKSKGYSDDQIQMAINFLKEFNHLDDRKYAELFIKDYLKRKPVAESRLISELFKRGIPREIAEDAVSEFFPADDEYALAYKAAEKKFRTIQHKTKEKQKSLLIAQLQRQGFRWDIIKLIIADFFSENDSI